MDIRTVFEFFDDRHKDNDCVMIIAYMLNYYKKHYDKQPCRDSFLTGEAYIMEILHRHGSRCFENFRMSTPIFVKLCGELKSLGLKDSPSISVYEQVGIFLLTLGHNERNHVVAERFQHSTYTISKYFHAVLQKVCDLGKQIIVSLNFNQVPNHIRKNKKYFPFFKNCVGAIDGTHVHANVPVDQQIPFRGRKGDTTQNVMAVCDFDMMFTYVVAGWDGSANDSKILNETINKEDSYFPKPPAGKYYLVNSRYANQPGFLAPYRGQRYCFQEYRKVTRHPQDREEIYNHRHSSLRNIIERCFGLLKMRFPILKQMPPYKFAAQVAIVLACCTLHNFIRKEAHVDPIFNDATLEAMIDEIFGDNDEVDVQPNASHSRARPMDIKRDRIADRIWNASQHP